MHIFQVWWTACKDAFQCLPKAHPLVNVDAPYQSGVSSMLLTDIRCAGEVQACADAASERVQALEAQLDFQSAEAETAASAAKAELESTQAEAAATLIAVRAELKAALDAAVTELASTKVVMPSACTHRKAMCLHGMEDQHES